MCLSTIVYSSISGLGQGWKLAVAGIASERLYTAGLGHPIEFDRWLNATRRLGIEGTEDDHGFHVYINRADALRSIIGASGIYEVLPVFFQGIVSIGLGDGRGGAGRNVPIVVAKRIYYPSSPFPDFPGLPTERNQ